MNSEEKVLMKRKVELIRHRNTVKQVKKEMKKEWEWQLEQTMKGRENVD